MLTVTDGSQVEPLIKIGTDFKMEQIVDGTFTVSFSCFPSKNNPGYELLKSESIITLDGNDFRVKVFADNVYSKSVTALSIFYDHLKTYRHGIFEGNHTLNNHINFALQGTWWTFTADANIANITNYIRSFGNDNVIKLVQKYASTMSANFKFCLISNCILLRRLVAITTINIVISTIFLLLYYKKIQPILITSSVFFGNSLPKSIEDTLANQEEKIGDTNEYIDETKGELKEEIEVTKDKLQGEFRSEIKKTDNRITLEVEHINTSIA